MNEARVYADGFERSFAEVKDLLEFLAERGRNAKWIRKPTNTLRLAPLEKEAQNLDAADASMEEILEDTEKNTQLVLKMRGESYPVRDCAIRTILSRAGVNGDGLRKLDKATYAKVVNYCLRVAKGDALIKIADGKVSAVHGGDKHDYCILDMKAMFETTGLPRKSDTGWKIWWQKSFPKRPDWKYFRYVSCSGIHYIRSCLQMWIFLFVCRMGHLRFWNVKPAIIMRKISGLMGVFQLIMCCR